jgi:hypothetical protein
MRSAKLARSRMRADPYERFLVHLPLGVLNRATKKGWIRRREGCSEDQLPWETGFPPFYFLTRPSREAWYPLRNGGT